MTPTRWLTQFLLALLMACGRPTPEVATPTPASASYRVVDATEAYLTYVDGLSTLPEDRRIGVFHERVIDVHPELFSPDVIGLDPTRKGAGALDERLATYLPTLAERAPGMHRVAQQIRQTLTEQDASFRRAFPDMRWHGTVYFTASIDAFDGALRDISTKDGSKERSLLFGIDKIVKIYGAETRIGPLFHHELFHCYHGELTPSLQPTEDSHGMIGPLWGEGLAVYVASRLTPDATTRELTLNDEMIRAADAHLGAIAAEIRTQLDDTSEATYRDFFLGAGKRDDLPKRVGYYVGFRVAKLVAERHGGDLRALARLKGPQLRGEVDEALAALK